MFSSVDTSHSGQLSLEEIGAKIEEAKVGGGGEGWVVGAEGDGGAERTELGWLVGREAGTGDERRVLLKGGV